jgi:hypothetical protein
MNSWTGNVTIFSEHIVACEVDVSNLERVRNDHSTHHLPDGIAKPPEIRQENCVCVPV